jgi:hypothetical protein
MTWEGMHAWSPPTQEGVHMRFLNARVKGVKADVAAGSITISFSVPLESLETAEEVARYCDKDAGAVAIVIDPMQIPMKMETKEE